MKYNSFFLLVFGVLLCIKPLFGQQNLSLLNTAKENQVLFYDDSIGNSDVATSFTTIIQEGYIINYFYKNNDNYYNYNIIFVPTNKLTIPLIQSIIKESIVVNKGKPLNEHYLLSKNDTLEFENLFDFSWVISHETRKEADSLEKLMGYNRKSINLLFSEFEQFNPPNVKEKNKINDSIGIVFKILKVKGVFKLESYDKKSQLRNNEVILSWQHGLENHVYITIYKKYVGLCLDNRFFTPILAKVLAVDFKDRKWRKKVSAMLKREKNDKK